MKETKFFTKFRICVLMSVLCLFDFVAGTAWALGESTSKNPAALKVLADGSVWVSKSDGALSCEPGSGQLLEKSVEDLKNKKIQVLEARKGTDGRMHIQMCGASVGTTIQVRVPKEDLPAVKAQGFEAMRTISERR